MPRSRTTIGWRWLVAILLIAAGVSTAQIRLEISDSQVILGSFCAGDPTQNLLTVGTTELRFTYDEPWRVVGRLVEPVRRVEDGTELPLDRARLLFPEVGDEFVGFEWFEIDHGSGRAEQQTWTLPWDVLQQRLIDYLDPADPPGVYRAFIDLALENSVTGERISDAASLLFEFDVLPWIELTLPTTWIEFNVLNGYSVSESDPFPVHIRSNAPWSLSLSWLGDLLDEETGDQISHELVSWRVEAGPAWESMFPEYTVVEVEPTLLARGDAPEPFDLIDMDIPVMFQCGPLGLRGGGHFRTQVVVDVMVEQGTRQ